MNHPTLARLGEVSVIKADWATRQQALEQVRGAVFIEEQGVPADIERDGLDSECQHLLAIDSANAPPRPVGAVRLMPDGRIGRMAVLPAYRGQGIGTLLLLGIVNVARSAGFKRLTLHAQVHALNFYSTHGFMPVGEDFIEGGINHRTMQLDLAAPDAGD